MLRGREVIGWEGHTLPSTSTVHGILGAVFKSRGCGNATHFALPSPCGWSITRGSGSWASGPLGSRLPPTCSGNCQQQFTVAPPTPAQAGPQTHYTKLWVGAQQTGGCRSWKPHGQKTSSVPHPCIESTAVLRTGAVLRRSYPATCTDAPKGSGQRRKAALASKTLGYIDCEGCPKPDSYWKPAKAPTFLKARCLWVGEGVPGQAWTELAEGGRVIFFGCFGGNRFWGRNLPLFQTAYILNKNSFFSPPNSASRVSASRVVLLPMDSEWQDLPWLFSYSGSITFLERWPPFKQRPCSDKGTDMTTSSQDLEHDWWGNKGEVLKTSSELAYGFLSDQETGSTGDLPQNTHFEGVILLHQKILPPFLINPYTGYQ